MPSPTGSHLLCSKLCRSFKLSSEKMQFLLSNLSYFFFFPLDLGLSCIQTCGLTGVGQGRGSCSSGINFWEDASLIIALDSADDIFLGLRISTLHIKKCADDHSSCPSPRHCGYFSPPCICTLNFSFWYLPLTSANPTHLGSTLRLLSFGTWHITSTAKPRC